MSVDQRIAHARELLAAQRYKESLAECDLALKQSPGNPEALALRKQVSDIIRILKEA